LIGWWSQPPRFSGDPARGNAVVQGMPPVRPTARRQKMRTANHKLHLTPAAFCLSRVYDSPAAGAGELSRSAAEAHG
jgi:hypothetical protein